MKVNNISASNYYNMNLKGNVAPKNSATASYKAGSNFAAVPRAFQNAQDTVSFTGLVPFQKLSPVIKQGISELPVSKALQKQLVNLAGGADTFFVKMGVLVENLFPEDATTDEKTCQKLFASLVDSVRDLLRGKGWDFDNVSKVFEQEKELFALLNKMNAEQDVVVSDVDRAFGKKITGVIDEILQKMQNGSTFSDEYNADLISRLTGIVKDVQAADPEGVKEFVKEVNAVKLPFWKK